MVERSDKISKESKKRPQCPKKFKRIEKEKAIIHKIFQRKLQQAKYIPLRMQKNSHKLPLNKERKTNSRSYMYIPLAFL